MASRSLLTVGIHTETGCRLFPALSGRDFPAELVLPTNHIFSGHDPAEKVSSQVHSSTSTRFWQHLSRGDGSSEAEAWLTGAEQ